MIREAAGAGGAEQQERKRPLQTMRSSLVCGSVIYLLQAYFTTAYFFVKIFKTLSLDGIYRPL
jgi:hypothetical protein